MSIIDIISILIGLLGGLGLFLHGMQMMSSGLEAAAGNRMKSILAKFTSNRFFAVLVGAVITAVVQSSSATTVMVVGFVNSGMMTLAQAVWIIMGANIGTTITGQMITLDIGAIAPLLAFVGIGMMVFVKNPKCHHYGNIVGGLGILFIGMNTMSSAMSPLRSMPEFVEILTAFENPLFGIAVGAIFTAIIQSSSASIGILQTLAASGLIDLNGAVFILFGQNIGTCITAVLASIGTNRNAKRATLFHLMFNLIGTAVFTILCLATPLTEFVASWTPTVAKAQIANMHTFFNICTTLLLLPVGGYLVKLVMKMLPDRPEDEQEGMHLQYLAPLPTINPDKSIGLSAIYLNQIQEELGRMLDMARASIDMAFHSVLNRNVKEMEQLEANEDYIDFLNKEISQFISRVITHEANHQDSATISAYFKITSNIERIGDHAMNVGGYTGMLDEKQISFSHEACEELKQMQEICLKAIDMVSRPTQGSMATLLVSVSAVEQKIDDMTLEFRQKQIGRMKSGTCSEEACILFAELLTDFERIGDHVLNIAEELTAAAQELIG